MLQVALKQQKREGDKLAFAQHEYTCKVCENSFEAAPPEWFENRNLSPPARCKDCKSSGKRIEHEYTCLICENTFNKAPPEWFKEKGLTPPIRCDECKRTGKRLSHTYTCKACEETFEKAPPEWYKGKGLSLPSRCDDCKASGRLPKKMYPCQSCGNKFPGAPSEWFGQKGLDLPRFCADCKAKGKTRLMLRFANSTPSSIDVPADREFYESIPLREEQKEKYRGQTQLDHIMAEGHGWDLSAEEVLEKARDIALNDDSDSVLQFDQGDGKIVKYFQPESWLVVITPDTRSSTGYRILTTYILGNGDLDVVKKVRGGRWML